MFCIPFCGSIGAEKPIFEEDGDFGNDGIAFFVFGGSNLDSRQQVFLCIWAQHTDRQLASG